MAGLIGTAVLVSLVRGTIAAYSIGTPSLNCSSTNSTSWEIRGFHVEKASRYFYGMGTVGRAKFWITNTANGYRDLCEQGSTDTGLLYPHPGNFGLKSDGKVWYTCGEFCQLAEHNPPLETSFHFDVVSKSLSVSQRWSCAMNNGNPSNVITLQGSGSALISNLTCKRIANGQPDQVTCEPFDIRIPASTVQVVTIPAHTVPKETKPPPDNSSDDRVNPGVYRKPNTVPPSILPETAGCAERSRAATWIVDYIDRKDVTGIWFQVTNTALNYTADCEIGNNRALRSGYSGQPLWQNCTDSGYFSKYHAYYPYFGVYTEILYYGGNWVYEGGGDILGINQTWYCRDDKSDQAIAFSAVSANVTIRHNCRLLRTCRLNENPEYSPSSTISERCSHPALTLTPTTPTFSAALPVAQAQDMFGGHGWNCSVPSLRPGGVVLSISDFVFTRTWTEGEASSPNQFRDVMDMVYTNPAAALGGVRKCSGRRRCDGYRDVVDLKFDYAATTMTLHAEWGCDGDLMRPDCVNYFEAWETVVLPLNCSKFVDDYANGTSCRVNGTIAVPVTNITMTLNSTRKDWDIL
ncbi:hypothetical protein B0T16DRAFT_463350 [Cercophora newfieldiana]|uniref:Uncharacterized protein n=1 Tax=Cercophora newfieldiana TaxID=92897 RepID=A0AA39XT24_9PEZI|nr:hypothetical protein B0T16DRAFT_463350 [Cercophora newfieldiana]